MNEAISKAFDKVADLLKGSKRAVFAAAIIFLFIYLLRLNIFDLYDFETQHFAGIPVIACIAAVGIIFGVFYFDEVVPIWITKSKAQYKTHRLPRNYLRFYLTGNQKRILTILVNSSDYSYFFTKTAEMDELEKWDILRNSPITKVVPTFGGEITEYRYTIQLWAYKFLKDNLELLETDFIFLGIKNEVAKFELKGGPTTTITYY